MGALCRPGAGEELIGRYGFTDVERIDVPFVLEFADPVTYARAMAATGPAYEAMQNVGEQQFLDAAVGEAETRVRVGLPLRAELALVGYLARKVGSNAYTSGSTGSQRQGRSFWQLDDPQADGPARHLASVAGRRWGLRTE